MQNEIDKWLEEYGDDAAFAEPARFIRELQASVTYWQKQAAFNLQYWREEPPHA